MPAAATAVSESVPVAALAAPAGPTGAVLLEDARVSSRPIEESRACDAWLARQIRGAVVHALALYDERSRPDLVEDLTQEVWCRLLERRALARFRGADDATRRRYLRRIAVNVVVDGLRLRSARKRQPARLLSLDAASSELERRFEPSDCPERRLLARERLRSLIALCRELVGDERRAERLWIARLGLLEGRPSAEIARHLGGGWTVVAIDSYLSRLRRRLGHHGVRLPFRARGRAWR